MSPFRLLLAALLALSTVGAHAQDAPGLGVGLFAIFVLLPLLPFVLLVALVVAIILLIKSKSSKETQAHHHAQEDKPTMGRLGE